MAQSTHMKRSVVKARYETSESLKKTYPSRIAAQNEVIKI